MGSSVWALVPHPPENQRFLLVYSARSWPLAATNRTGAAATRQTFPNPVGIRVAPVRSAPPGGKYNASGMRGLCATAHKTWAHPMGCPHFALREHSSGTRVQEPVPFTPDHTVALAYSRFETRAVEDSNATTMITNQSGVL